MTTVNARPVLMSVLADLVGQFMVASGYPFLRISYNLSDIGNAAAARTNLGLGGMATQAPGAVAITGGTVTADTSGATVLQPGGAVARTLVQWVAGGPVRVNAYAGAAGDGSTDNTAPVNAAYAYALSASARDIRFEGRPGSVYLIGGTLTGSAQNVVFRGEGATLNTAFRKHIIPDGAPGPAPVPPTIRPDIHLQPSRLAPAPVWGIIGDSTSTLFANGRTSAAALPALWERYVRAANPGRAMTFKNYGVGGQTWATLATKPGGFPWWYTNAALDWLTYPQAAGVDQLLIVAGINDSRSGGFSLSAFLAVFATIAGWAKVPGLFVATPLPVALTQTPYYDSNDALAMFTRSYAECAGHAVVDFHRQAVKVRDGFDPLSVPLELAASPAAGATIALPYTGPRCNDFGTVLRFATSGPAMWTAVGNELQFKFGSSYVDAGNVFRVGYNPGTGKLYVRIDTSLTRTFYAQTDTAFDVSGHSGASWIEFVVRGYHVMCIYRQFDPMSPSLGPAEYVLWNGIVERFGGGFQPVISCTAGVVSAAIGASGWMKDNLDRLLTLPSLVDQELFGATGAPASGVWGGDAGAHVGTPGGEAIYDAVLRAQDWTFGQASAYRAWAPNPAIGGSAAGITKSVCTGKYLLLPGGLVWIDVDIQLTSKGSGSGVFQIFGLPFAPAADTATMVVGYWANWSGMSGAAPIVVVTSGGVAQVYVPPGGTAATDANLANNSILRFTGTYRAA